MIDFAKFHGYGNDYLVLEAAQLTHIENLCEFFKRLCDRHFGVGSDGAALIEKIEAEGDVAELRDRSPSAPAFRVRIFNHDGSEAAMSGNGTRCAVAYLYREKLWTQDELRLDTLDGMKLYRLRERDDRRGRYRFAAEIGRPAFASEAVPMTFPPAAKTYGVTNALPDAPYNQSTRGGQSSGGELLTNGEQIKTGGAASLAIVRDYPLDVAGEQIPITALQMCNPNVCVFVEDFEQTDWRRQGRLIETHPQFPERTNVVFVRVIDQERIEIRIWERGVGETLASGTGACAALVAGVIDERTARRCAVEMPGGSCAVEWRADDDVVVLTGVAQFVFYGQFDA